MRAIMKASWLTLATLVRIMASKTKWAVFQKSKGPTSRFKFYIRSKIRASFRKNKFRKIKIT